MDSRAVTSPDGIARLGMPARDLDARAMKVADCVLTSPADAATRQIRRDAAGLSSRTLERLFRAETGMPFGLWRQKAKLFESVRVLVERVR